MTATLSSLHTLDFKISEPVLLEGGQSLSNINIRYTTFGALNADRSNVVWIFHALTGTSNPTEWWEGLFDESSAFDINQDFIVCANMLGSCHGTTSPENKDFPLFTIRDIVKLHQKLRDHLKIDKIKIGIGGSMGGQQLLEWASQEPDLFEHIVPIATNACHSPWAIAFNEVQRMALENLDKGKGLETARAIAMLSYRHYKTFDYSQKDSDQRWNNFRSSSYVRYQGEKLRQRFTTESYYYLSKAMDSHNLGRHAVSLEAALSRINASATVIGVDSDLLFPIEEQKFIARHLKNATYHQIDSVFGHDGFLVETAQLNNILTTQIHR